MKPQFYILSTLELIIHIQFFNDYHEKFIKRSAIDNWSRLGQVSGKFKSTDINQIMYKYIDSDRLSIGWSHTEYIYNIFRYLKKCSNVGGQECNRCNCKQQMKNKWIQMRGRLRVWLQDNYVHLNVKIVWLAKVNHYKIKHWKQKEFFLFFIVYNVNGQSV